METPTDQELSLQHLLRIVRERIPIVFTLAGVGFVAALCVALLTTRRYEAVTTIQVEKQTSDYLDLSSFMGAPVGVSDALSQDVDLQTEVHILQSETLATRTIEKLRLASARDFQPKKSLLGRILAPLGLRGDASSVPSEAVSHAALLKTFQANLSVNLLPGTRLIEIHYRSSEPVLAAAVANQLAQEVIDYGFETKFKTTQTNSEALSRQLAELRVRSETLQTQVAQMQRDSGLYSTGATDAQGRQQSYSSILDQFQRASIALSDAEQNRILKQAVYQAARSGSAETLSGLSGNSSAGGGSAMANSLSTIQAFRTQEATIQVQLSQLRAKFGSGYPKVGELGAEIASIEEAIRQETERVAKRAESDFLVADQTWKIARRNYTQLKDQADALNDKAIHYMISRQEADDSRTLYEDLLKRLQQAGVMEGLKSTTTTILDVALVPVRPQTPNVTLYLAGGTCGGIVLSLLIIIIGYALDDRVRDAQVVEGCGYSLAGILPIFKSGEAWAEVVQNPNSCYSEMVRSIRSAVMESGTPPAAKVLLITSAVTGEGKSTFSLNLAANLAQRGMRVLFIEADLRQPSLRSSLALGPTVPGLAQLLDRDFGWDALATRRDLPLLYLVPAGIVPSNPAELLDSERMRSLLARARLGFDVVVLDGPPLLPVVDARALSRLADITVQMIQCNVTKTASFRRAAGLLKNNAGGRSVCVLNGVDPKSSAFRSYVGQVSDFQPEGILQHESI